MLWLIRVESAGFAVESFQSLYLKTYYSLEFMVAVVNNFGGFYRTEMYVHEARRWGGIIEAPEINLSRYLTHIQGKTIYAVGLQQLMLLIRIGAFRNFGVEKKNCCGRHIYE